MNHNATLCLVKLFFIYRNSYVVLAQIVISENKYKYVAQVDGESVSFEVLDTRSVVSLLVWWVGRGGANDEGAAPVAERLRVVKSPDIS